jgi:hypothetical protein
MKRFPRWLPAVALLAVWGGGARAALADEGAGSIRRIPCGVADASGTRGFVATLTNGVEALDLETGEVLWAYKPGGDPLAVVGGRVLLRRREPGKPNAFRLVALDAESGKKTAESEPVVLAEWVTCPDPWEGVVDSFFQTRPLLDKGDLYLTWEARKAHAVPNSPEGEVITDGHAQGVLRFHPADGTIDRVDPDQAPAPPKPSPALIDAAERHDWNGYDGRMVATAGRFAVAVDLDFDGDRDGLKAVLRRWDLAAEKEREPIVLARIKSGWLEVVRDVWGGVAFVELVPPGKGTDEADEWTVYSLETGEAVARLPAGRGAPWTVLGRRVYHFQFELSRHAPFGNGRSADLKASDLKTGKLLWEHSLGDDPTSGLLVR